MQFKVKDIGEEGLEVRVPVTAAWLSGECPDLQAWPADEGLALTGRLEPSGEDYLLRGKLSGGLIVPCARCLDQALVPVDADVTVSYVEAEDDADEDDPFGDDEDGGDVLTFRDGVIDLAGEMRDEILLAIPIGPLCRPDCAGICPVCGGNRNQSPCDCVERQRLAQSKFGVLKDFKV